MSVLDVTREASVTTALLNNPPANVLTIDLINEVNHFLASVDNEQDTKVVVFKSANPLFFSAHFDLNLINGTAEGHAGCMAFSQMIKSLKQLKPLSIAVVDGCARGGGDEFVMACDLSFGTENAVFAQPEIGVNIPTGGQGGVQYARRMGRSKALQSLLTGRDHSAQEAERLNIITQYVPKADMDSFLDSQLAVINSLDRRDIAMYKDIVATSIMDEDAGVELELKYFLDRAGEEKSQTIFKAFLKSGGQTEREATDFMGIFADTVAELSRHS
ncbi:enoyl-CoA hydratase/isomerase family protein [Endozoicomonas elysicola]|uniref:Enoyl-CoA hydratase n=1 Tax=Endozoicomonas elysicola TaxID=305900 RepID=A0A081K815_9GAMM|nr:enoyl-CoA hydratase/isomerase family protein [Endozoicomonas elysicola]KEI70291.1 enoyl-CoA hydratase [Endozoicomonas elysicola]